jgi:hypothetical protein
MGAALGVGGVHTTARTCQTTELAGREGTLVRGASHRVKGREIGVSLATPTKLRRLQEALYTQAKQEPAYRFYLLYDKVYRMDILAHAYALSKQHGGAPGVDGVTFADIEAAGVEPWLAAVQEALRTEISGKRPNLILWLLGGARGQCHSKRRLVRIEFHFDNHRPTRRATLCRHTPWRGLFTWACLLRSSHSPCRVHGHFFRYPSLVEIQKLARDCPSSSTSPGICEMHEVGVVPRVLA